jgi:hypothetical protein
MDSIHWYATRKTVEMGVARKIADSVSEIGGRTKLDVRDAAKYALVPGATGVLNTLNKPTLVAWGAKTTAEAAYDLLSSGTAPLAKEAFVEECLKRKDEVGKAAATEGTRLHAFSEDGFNGRPLSEEGQLVYSACRREVDDAYPGAQWVPELSAVHPIGFGCRGDLFGYHDGIPQIYVDIKTRDFGPEDVDKARRAKAKGYKGLGRLTPRETEVMQAAANITAIGGVFRDHCCANLYLSRTHPGLTYLHSYTIEQIENGWTCFQALCRVWYILKGLEVPEI